MVLLPAFLCCTRIFRATARNSILYKKWHEIFLLKTVLLIVRFALIILGIRINHTGTPFSRKEAPIIVLAPHGSFLDSFFLVYHGWKTGTPPSPVVQSAIMKIP